MQYLDSLILRGWPPRDTRIGRVVEQHIIFLPKDWEHSRSRCFPFRLVAIDHTSCVYSTNNSIKLSSKQLNYDLAQAGNLSAEGFLLPLQRKDQFRLETSCGLFVSSLRRSLDPASMKCTWGCITGVAQGCRMDGRLDNSTGN